MLDSVVDISTTGGGVDPSYGKLANSHSKFRKKTLRVLMSVVLCTMMQLIGDFENMRFTVSNLKQDVNIICSCRSRCHQHPVRAQLYIGDSQSTTKSVLQIETQSFETYTNTVVIPIHCLYSITLKHHATITNMNMILIDARFKIIISNYPTSTNVHVFQKLL